MLIHKINFSEISNGLTIDVWSVNPVNPVSALYIVHGMMEHSARYRAFAEWMAEKGIAVYSADLPGHGISVNSRNDLGHLDVKSGWKEILESVRSVLDLIREKHPGLPVIMLGHSFGSVVARSFSQRYSRDYPLSGLILSGAMQQPSVLLRSGLGLIALQRAFFGSRHPSKLMIALGHGQYAKYFMPKRTDFDWLSSDPKVVDAYLADPLCGYACTLGYYRNFFHALITTWKYRSIRKTPPDLPVLLLGGKCDPAIRFGKDTRSLACKYHQCGLKHVDVELFEKGRHEMLNELRKTEVWSMIGEWMTIHDKK